MDDDELSKLANQFITLWQEKFATSMADPQILGAMMQAAGNMQQFYDKSLGKQFTESASAAFKYPYEPGSEQHDRGELLSRIDELEKRVAELEKVKKPNPKTSKK